MQEEDWGLKFVHVCLRKCCVELQRMYSFRCQICCSNLELGKMSCCLAQRLVSQALIIAGFIVARAFLRHVILTLHPMLLESKRNFKELHFKKQNIKASLLCPFTS